MSKSKEKKIERIKNQKIWPFVVMIVVTILVSVGMSVAILVLSIRSLLVNKADSMYQVFQEVENAYFECQNSGEDFSVAAEMIYYYTPDVKGICVVDENNELLQQYGDSAPDFQQLINMNEDDSGEYDPQKPSLWTEVTT